jgi:hypothetical protein
MPRGDMSRGMRMIASQELPHERSDRHIHGALLYEIWNDIGLDG